MGRLRPEHEERPHGDGAREEHHRGLPGQAAARAVHAGLRTRAARISRPNRWTDALSPMADGLPGWSCTTRCDNLIRTVPEVPWDEKDKEVEDGKSENHAYEGVGRFFEARPFAPRAEVVDPYQDLDPLSRAHHQAQDKRLEGGKCRSSTSGCS